jgi:hypothetical protein
VFPIVEIAQNHHRMAVVQLFEDQLAQHPGFGHPPQPGAQKTHGAALGTIVQQVQFWRMARAVRADIFAQLRFHVAVEHGDHAPAHRYPRLQNRA